MASSNRHWPSLFKSKHCSNHHHHNQWQHAIATSSSSSTSSLLPNACQRPPYASGPGCEERTPEPKPRWNPKPEQIRILEAIFNSGMVNPPRDEIRKIRAQLQEYGQVGDANVFYWFQNRKSRSKHKLRHLQASRQAGGAGRGGGGGAAGSNNNANNNLTGPSGGGAGSSCAPVSVAVAPTSAAPCNSSSSSERSTNSGASDRTAFASSMALGVGLSPGTALMDAANGSVMSHATYLHHGEPPLPTGGGEPFSFLHLPQGYPPLPADDMSVLVAGIPDPSLELFSGLRAAELMGQHHHQHHHGCVKSSRNMDALATDTNKMQLLHLQQNAVYGTPTAAESTAVTTTAIVTTADASPISEIHAGKPAAGAGSSGSSGCSGGAAAAAAPAPRLVAFINGLVFEVAEPGLINVKEVFGDEAVLFHANGNPVLVDDWGVTLEPLQHGASYFLV